MLAIIVLQLAHGGSDDTPVVTLASASLDSSATALAGAPAELVVGGSGSADDGHDHDHGGGDGHDDVHQYWSTIPSSPSSYVIDVGDKLIFKYTAYHNVYLMPSEAAYEACDFSNATELASTSHGGGSGEMPNLYETIVTAAGKLYVACQVGNHCGTGQKVAISVTEHNEESAAPRLTVRGSACCLPRWRASGWVGGGEGQQ